MSDRPLPPEPGDLPDELMEELMLMIDDGAFDPDAEWDALTE